MRFPRPPPGNSPNNGSGPATSPTTSKGHFRLFRPTRQRRRTSNGRIFQLEARTRTRACVTAAISNFGRFRSDQAQVGAARLAGPNQHGRFAAATSRTPLIIELASDRYRSKIVTTSPSCTSQHCPLRTKPALHWSAGVGRLDDVGSDALIDLEQLRIRARTSATKVRLAHSLGRMIAIRGATIALSSAVASIWLTSEDMPIEIDLLDLWERFWGANCAYAPRS
jgi:hypothetical protein